MLDLPTVTLAGKEWPVKPLVILQLRVVVPAVMRIKTMVPSSITEEQYSDLIEIVYQAIAPGQSPPLKKEDFLTLPISLREMMEALDVIMPQAGLVKAEGGQGEAPASSTGTQS